MRTPLKFALLAAAVISMTACSQARPKVRVVGVSQTNAHRVAANSEIAQNGDEVVRTRQFVLFLQIVNTTPRQIRLSKLRYRVDSASWLHATGEVSLTRRVDTDSAVVVAVPVRVDASVPADSLQEFSFRGTLFAFDQKIEKSWNVNVIGSFETTQSQRKSLSKRVALVE